MPAVDPMRKELGAPVNDKRFERVLVGVQG